MTVMSGVERRFAGIAQVCMSTCISSSEAMTSLTSSLQTLIEINSFDQRVTKTYPRLRRFNRWLLYFNEWSGTVLNKEKKEEAYKPKKDAVCWKRSAYRLTLLIHEDLKRKSYRAVLSFPNSLCVILFSQHAYNTKTLHRIHFEVLTFISTFWSRACARDLADFDFPAPRRGECSPCRISAEQKKVKLWCMSISWFTVRWFGSYEYAWLCRVLYLHWLRRNNPHLSFKEHYGLKQQAHTVSTTSHACADFERIYRSGRFKCWSCCRKIRVHARMLNTKA